MIGLSLYFIALLAVAEAHITENKNLDTSVTTTTVSSDEQQSEPTQYALIVEEESTPQPITLTNTIEPHMLAYKHWTGTYSPDVFDLYINDTKVSYGETYTLTNPSEPFIIKFDYSFMKGMRKGTKAFSYHMKKDGTSATLTFSWLDPWKVLIDNATPLKEEINS